ncbi:MAG: hypothetical protein LBC39_01220 [Methanobrevibacter sp.]|nr:hypothetical protein [Candidatus Methanovirga aequatorialis]
MNNYKYSLFHYKITWRKNTKYKKHFILKIEHTLSYKNIIKFIDCPPTMTAEDFGFITQKFPLVMFWVGVGGDYPLHSPYFLPNSGFIMPYVEKISGYLLTR